MRVLPAPTKKPADLRGGRGPWLGLALGLTMLATASARADVPVPSLSDEQAELLLHLTERWVMIDMPRVRLFAAEPERVHPVALHHLEHFLEATLDSLRAPEKVRAHLRLDPIRYFLCAHPQEVQLLGGTRSEGISLLERRSIVSRWLPHDHEVVHVLAHEVVAPGPALVPPLLQEGLASAWGGQRGLAPQVVVHRGELQLRTSDLDLTRLWEYDEFHTFSRDLSASYAVSARFVQYLLDAYGVDPFLRLYRLLAGEAEEVRQRPAQANILQLEQVYGTSWPALLEDFQGWRRVHPTRFATKTNAPYRAADLRAQHDGRFLSVWDEADGSMVFRLEGVESAPEGLVTWGAPLPETYRTRLYTGRRQGRLPRYGLRIMPAGLELYDYGMDQIVAELHEQTGIDEIGTGLSRQITVRLLPGALSGVERPYDVELVASPRVEY
jgi:hypothetical protein